MPLSLQAHTAPMSTECWSDQLKGESLAPESPDFVERVNIPGVLTGRSVKLFSGQIVPVIELINTRGVYGWHVDALMDAATTAAATLCQPRFWEPQQLHRMPTP